VSGLEDKLAEPRVRFQARAGDELAVIEAALANGDRPTIIDRAHKLAGIAGMFGYPEIGDAAFSLEQAALADEETGGALLPAGERLRTLLAALAASS